MSLSPGGRIGNFEVIAKLGEGGMGQVYRARDVTLHREVAIKVLPETLTADPDRLARFVREAQSLAALNHPNIAQIHDASAGAYIVMELVEGEDLSEILSRGPMPLAEALPIARQIAQGLEAAHDQGIVHRDLKPANIKVRPDGTVKILDFGLAKAVGPQSAVSQQNAMNSPTLTAHATQLGIILGTAAYMSPEQARGKPVDRRADVWAFGVILYEMLTGRRAFEGTEVSDVLASVLKDTLPIESIPGEVPPSIRRLLKRCLQKDRADRLDSMATARLEIIDALSGDHRADAASAASTAVAAPARPSWIAIAAAMMAVAALAAWAGATLTRTPSTGVSGVVALDVSMPGEVTGVAITPSGDTLVLESDRLYLRTLSDPTLRPIPGTEGGRNLAMSPDGKWVAFNAGNQLKKVALTGGDPLVLADVTDDSPGSGWGPDKTILFTPGWGTAMFSVSTDGGGKPNAVSTVNAAAGEIGHWWPQLLPDGKSVLFTIWMTGAGINDSKIGVLDLSSGTHRVLAPGAFARYTSSGHVVYFNAGKYFASKFDLKSMTLSGEPVAVMDDVLPHDPLGTRRKPWAVANNGTLVSIAGPLFTRAQFAWVTPAGAITRIDLPAEAIHSADVSPDGRWLVTCRVEGGITGLWLTDLTRQTTTKLALPGSSFTPLWSSDGRFFLFTSMRAGHFDAFQYRVEEARAVAVIDEPLDQGPMALSNDKSTMIVGEYLANGQGLFSYASLDAPSSRHKIDGLTTLEEVRFSPDDKWIAVETIVNGREQISVRSFPGPGPVVNLTPNGGSDPIWAPKNSRLYYKRENEILGVTYSLAGGRFSVVDEGVLVRLAQRFELLGIAPDGRFLIGLELPNQSLQPRVMLNWFSHLPK